jgi:hypothetical protein
LSVEGPHRDAFACDVGRPRAFLVEAADERRAAIAGSPHEIDHETLGSAWRQAEDNLYDS